jgi:endonuclease/exonuclease/phosphatase family metal-dependent hydrolase
MNVLFWNLNGQRRDSICANLVKLHAVDVLILAECPQPRDVLAAINAHFWSYGPYTWTPSNSRLQHFLSPRYSGCRLLAQNRRWTAHAFFVDTDYKLLCFSVHLKSGRHSSVREQEHECQVLAIRVRELEEQRQHTRSVLVGDLNANPEDVRVYSALGLHAVPQRAEALRMSRVVEDVRYPFFFNPMTRFSAQQAPKPSGTFHWRSSIHDLRPWNTLDQLLIRPSLLSCLTDENVQIIVGDGEVSFQRSDATPDPIVASDHFPILVHLNYPGA